jgi:proteasome lid subunit RPN8/RPN11
MNTIWTVPKHLLSQSIAAMRPYGAKGHEGLCLWFGNEEKGTVSISHLVVPYGPGLTTHPLHLSLSPRAMSRLTRLAAEIDAYWVGQIHSHPGLMLELSEVDCRFGILVQDYLSVVCPYYAQRPVENLSDCGVHVFDSGRYRRLAAREIKSKFKDDERIVEVIHLEVLA